MRSSWFEEVGAATAVRVERDNTLALSRDITPLLGRLLLVAPVCHANLAGLLSVVRGIFPEVLVLRR